jgi:D-glycero-D-manno-heptose 1,7-bisphosphate phosphatase
VRATSRPVTPTTKAAFLDRDGVINRDHGFVHRIEDFEFLPGAVEGMRCLAEAGFSLIVVTNQSGIARGLYDEADFETLTAWMCDELAARGVLIHAIYHCPHHPEGTVAPYARVCDCRKPAPGLLLRARAEHGIDMAASIMIGDKLSDMAAGRAAGVTHTFLIAPRGAAASSSDASGAEAIFTDLQACARHIQEADK